MWRWAGLTDVHLTPERIREQMWDRPTEESSRNGEADSSRSLNAPQVKGADGGLGTPPVRRPSATRGSSQKPNGSKSSRDALLFLS